MSSTLTQDECFVKKEKIFLPCLSLIAVRGWRGLKRFLLSVLAAISVVPGRRVGATRSVEWKAPVAFCGTVRRFP
jgi:hypothetical protein